MSKFEQMFRLWLAGFGVDEQQANKLCAHPRIVMDIKTQDSGGLVIDLDRALFECNVRNDELRAAFDTPMEKLLLISVLR